MKLDAVSRTIACALLLALELRADVAPPRSDPKCTAAEQARFVGQCLECCMGDGCPHPEVRCPAEERFRQQRCVRFADPPYSAPTYAVWCDPSAKPSGAAALLALARLPAVWIGGGLIAATALGVIVFFARRKSRHVKT